jgi:alcohol dehydrogenase (cytochrome c)
MLAASTLLDRAILMPAGAQVPPAPAAASTPPPEGAAAPRPTDTPYAKAALATMRAPLDKLTPVTDGMLRNPPPGDWLHWRRTYDGWANSPLTQINRDTVIWKFLPNQF